MHTRCLRLGLVLGVVVVLNLAGTWLGQQVNFQLFPRHSEMLEALLIGAAALYVLLMATPFMPGIEVGLAIMLLLGPEGALLVYLCTLAALSLSYLVGLLIPVELVHRLLHWLHLHRAAALTRELERVDRPQRLRLLYEKAPARLVPFLLNHRYAMVAVLLNLPGNALIGGGGGIGLVVGMSGLIPFTRYLVVIALAIAPVPLGFYLVAG